MKSIQVTCLLFLFTSLVPAAHAARIYELVNYPDLQSGHTLSGTITTTDDAPDDGLLETEEIRDWEWMISGQTNIWAVYEPTNGTAYPPTISEDIAISPSSIELPSTAEATLSLMVVDDLGGGSVHTVGVGWATYFLNSSDIFVSVNSTSLFFDDVVQDYWYSTLDPPQESNWVIAEFIPEPSVIAISVAAALFITATRSHPESSSFVTSVSSAVQIRTTQSSARLPSPHIFTMRGSNCATICTRSCWAAMTWRMSL